MRLHNRLEVDVNSLIVQVLLGERTAEYMRAYASGNASLVRCLYNAVGRAYMLSRDETFGWACRLRTQRSTDHNCLVRNRFTTRVLVAPEFYVHVMATRSRRLRWRSNEERPTVCDGGGSEQECTETIETLM